MARNEGITENLARESEHSICFFKRTQRVNDSQDTRSIQFYLEHKNIQNYRTLHANQP